MARPETLRRVAAAEVAYRDLQRHARRIRRSGQTPDTATRREIQEARAEYHAARKQAFDEDEGRTTWNARFYKDRNL